MRPFHFRSSPQHVHGSECVTHIHHLSVTDRRVSMMNLWTYLTNSFSFCLFFWERTGCVKSLSLTITYTFWFVGSLETKNKS